MTNPTREIVWSRSDADYTLLIDGSPCGSFRSYVAAEDAADRIIADRLSDTQALDLAQLALDYQRAKLEGRTEDARQIRQRAMALEAHRLGVSYDVFCQEYQTYRSVVKEAA